MAGLPEGAKPGQMQQFSAMALNAFFWICICVVVAPRLNFREIEVKKGLEKLKFFLAGLGLIFLTMFVWGNFLEFLKRTTGYDPGLQNVAEQVKALSAQSIFLTVLVTAILVPVIEELLFRGFLYRALKNSMSVGLAAAISAAAGVK